MRCRLKNTKAFGQLSGMLVLTLCTQLVLVLKSSRVAALFGTGIEMDAYNFVNSIASFVFSFKDNRVAVEMTKTAENFLNEYQGIAMGEKL